MTVTEALYSVLLDFHRGRADSFAVEYGSRCLYDAATLTRIYTACRAELVATNEQVPKTLEAVGRREAARGRCGTEHSGRPGGESNS